MDTIRINLNPDDLAFYMDVFDKIADRDRLVNATNRMLDDYDATTTVDLTDGVLEVRSLVLTSSYERYAALYSFLLPFIDAYFERLRAAHETWKAVAE